MRFELTITVEDIVNYNLHLYQTSVEIRRKSLRYRSFVFGFSLLAFAMIFITPSSNLAAKVLNCFVFVLSLAFFVFFDYFQKRKISKAIRNKLKDSSNSEMLGKQAIEIDESRITVRNQFSKIHYARQAILKLTEDSNYLFLQLNPSSCIIMRKLDISVSAIKEKLEAILNTEPLIESAK